MGRTIQPHLTKLPISKPPRLVVASPNVTLPKGKALGTTKAKQVNHRRRGWAVLWAGVIHVLIVFICGLLQFAPNMIAQIGNAVTMSMKSAVDYQEENQEEAEEMVLQSQQAPPPQPAEAAIPELVPLLTESDLVMPEPTELADVQEIEVEVVDVGMNFGEGFEPAEELEEVLQETAMFSAPAKGNCTIFVIDVSTSMPRELCNAGIANLKQDLKRAIDAMPEDQLFNLICFGDKADGFSRGPIFATTQNKILAHRFMTDYFTGKFRRTRTGTFGRKGIVNKVRYVPIEPNDVVLMGKTGGGSRYDMALMAAFQQRATTVYLVTDGVPSTTRQSGFFGANRSMSDKDILRTVSLGAQRLYKKDLPQVNCVSINGIGAMSLKQVAMTFNGTFRTLGASR